MIALIAKIIFIILLIAFSIISIILSLWYKKELWQDIYLKYVKK